MERTILACHQERLFKVILAFSENRFCADCESLNPDWVSFNFGVFICYKCSGTHRSFGMHITRVKSTSLDTWSLRQIYIIGSVDNVQSNAYWEANLPNTFIKPNFDSAPNELASFTRKKYIERVFAPADKKSPAEEFSNDPNITEVPTEGENQNDFYQRKLEDFKMALKSRANAASPDISRRGITPLQIRSCRKSGTQFLEIPPKTFSLIPGETDESPSKKKVRALVSPFGTSILAKKEGLNQVLFPKRVAFGSTTVYSACELPLFAGLNVKTQTTIEEEPNAKLAKNPKKFMRLHTQEVISGPCLDSRSYFPSTQASSKNNVGLFTSKTKLTVQFDDEISIFDENKRIASGNMSRASLEEDIELQDMSELSRSRRSSRRSFLEGKIPAVINHNEEYNNYDDEEHEPAQSCSSVRTQNSMHIKFSDTIGADSHLKRPGEAFEISKYISMQELPQPKLKRGEFCSRYGVLFSGFLLHLVMGYMYCWGSISPYIASYVMGDYKDDGYIEHTGLNMMIFLGVSMGFCLCEKLGNALGMRLLVILSLLGLSSGLLICSFAQDVILYSGFLTIVPGFFIGILYEIPFFCASQYYGTSQVRLRSLFYIANGIGAFGYTYLSYFYLSLVDTQNSLDISQETSVGLYPESVVNNVPNLLSMLSCTILVISAAAGLLLRPRASFIIRDWRDRDEGLLGSKRPSISRKLKRKATTVFNQGLKDALDAPTTKALLSIMMLFPVLGSYLLYSYKCIGFSKNYSDAEMALLGGVGMIALNIGKTIGVIIHRQCEFRSLCSKIIMYQAMAGVALFISGRFIDASFLGLFVVIMLLDGLVFSLIVEEIKFVHPDDVEDSMVALVILGYTIANFISFIIVKTLFVLALEGEAILVLTLPLYFAYRILQDYSRGSMDDNSDFVAMLLDV